MKIPATKPYFFEDDIAFITEKFQDILHGKSFLSNGQYAAQFEKEFAAEYKATIEELLRESDFVSIHVPLLDSTRHLINAERLRLMKPGAYLVNTSRGPIVDEMALRDALKAGVIRAAAIDVWEHEPELTPGLADLDNVTITPHTASATEETRQKMGEVAAANIIAALSGQTPPNIIKA